MTTWKRHCRLRSWVWMILLGGVLPGVPAAGPHHHSMQNAPPADTYSPDSLYQLTSTWTTPAGQRLQLGALRGKVRVIVMHDTSCDDACPTLISLLKHIETELPQTIRDQVGFVGVTFDPERDTLPVLQAYQAKMHLDAQSWTLLRGQPGDVLELAVLLGVKYRQGAQGDFSHSNLITVLNQKGEIVYRQTGLRRRVGDTIAAIQRIAQDATR